MSSQSKMYQWKTSSSVIKKPPILNRLLSTAAEWVKSWRSSTHMHFSIILGGHVVVLFLSNRYEEGLGTKMALPRIVFSRSASAIILFEQANSTWEFQVFSDIWIWIKWTDGRTIAEYQRFRQKQLLLSLSDGKLHCVVVNQRYNVHV